MRYYDMARSMPGRPDIAGSPRDLNAHYEAVAIPKLLTLGTYPLFAGASGRRRRFRLGSEC